VALSAETLRDLRTTFDELATRARGSLGDARDDDPKETVELRVELRYAGTDTPLAVPFGDEQTVRAAFEAAHERLFGFARPGDTIEIVSARVEARRLARELPVRAEQRALTRREPERPHQGAAPGIPVWDHVELPAQGINGPALVVDDTTTIV